MNIDPFHVAALIDEIANAEIAPRFGALADGAVRTKAGPNDFVTEADEAAEAALKKALGALRPDAVFVGEESAAADPSLDASLGGSSAYWIVDPLDGTRNFVQGVREFATIVAFAEGGRTRMGWIYAIPERSCAIAIEGEGVSWEGARVSPPAPLQKPSGLRSVGWLSREWRDRLAPNLRAKLETRPARCSAYAYLSLMRGDADFAIHSKVQAWDHAAGALLMSEIGGRTAFLDDGSAYGPAPTANRPLLAAASVKRWEDVRAALLDKP
ncbi:MAG: inositol monophosphatase family protein [Parvularculaceae bacterium]